VGGGGGEEKGYGKIVCICQCVGVHLSLCQSACVFVCSLHVVYTIYGVYMYFCCNQIIMCNNFSHILSPSMVT
jgi:hypothetical protein